MTALEIVRIPVLSDNYVWLVHDPDSKATMVVDPAVADPVLEAAKTRGWPITAIWNTHWHPDHTGGNAAIKEATGCTITGPAAEYARIPTLDVQVTGGDTVRLGNHVASVWDVPAHTAGHIAYHFADDAAIFVGDTMFAMGCGRLFEGTPQQMWDSLQRLAALPDDTKVYCAHEYTASNARFALSVDDEPAVKARTEAIFAARERGEWTVPTTIGLEKATNPFLRAPALAGRMGLSGAPDHEAFAAIRAAKDSFKG